MLKFKTLTVLAIVVAVYYSRSDRSDEQTLSEGDESRSTEWKLTDEEALDARIWGNENSFSHEIVRLLDKKKEIWGSLPQYSSTLNEDRKSLEQTIQRLASSAKGERVPARVSVMENSNGVIRLLADITYGFPTQAPLDARSSLQLHLPQHSAVVLEVAGGKDLSLVVGKEIDETVAKRLRWNDKILVSFLVDDVKLRHIRHNQKSDAELEAWGLPKGGMATIRRKLGHHDAA